VSEIDDFVRLAEAMAHAVRPVVLGYFASPVLFETKADLSPVTAADREAEALMRRLIETELPAHGILGEEYGADRVDATYVWVLDPIDGTKSFVTGKPLFGTLIALLREGRPIIGVIDMPALDQRWLGVEGRPTDAFERLRSRCYADVYGADLYAYGLLARGRIDLVCEASLQPYDYCAAVPIIEGAGGGITTWEGQPLGLFSGPRVLAAGDKRVHRAAREALAPA
jgi:inositol-phosphate phosphatase / L-galactose 1-phosphate phosphatase / histidinol-phosphatase